MSTPSDAMPETAAQPAPPASPPTRPFYWSVRREIWENRSVYMAPPIVAGVVLFGFLLGLFALPHQIRAVEAGIVLHGKHPPDLAMPYSVAALAVLLIGFLVAVFYSLGALHGERRDRSILFWKSLPVSDLTTVLSKAAVPLVVLPVVVFVTIVAVHVVMMALSVLVLLANGLSPMTLWAHFTPGFMWLVLAYGLIVMALWGAPIYGWLLLVSGWARRMTFLWAVAPPLAVCLVEKLAFGTTYVIHLLGERLVGGFGAAFSIGGRGREPVEHLADLDPVRFLTTPGLWGGLVVAAAFLAGAVWQRRYRGPI